MLDLLILLPASIRLHCAPTRWCTWSAKCSITPDSEQKGSKARLEAQNLEFSTFDVGSSSWDPLQRRQRARGQKSDTGGIEPFGLEWQLFLLLLYREVLHRHRCHLFCYLRQATLYMHRVSLISNHDLQEERKSDFQEAEAAAKTVRSS